MHFFPAIEDHERKTDRDAQISILKQMLLTTPQSNDPHTPNEKRHKHQSFHEGDDKGHSYRQMLERLLVESNANGQSTRNYTDTRIDGCVTVSVILRFKCI